jgi:hypothetical protein
MSRWIPPSDAGELSLRRIAGALVGAAVAGLALFGIVAIGEHTRWWHMAIPWKPCFLRSRSPVVPVAGLGFFSGDDFSLVMMFV